MILHLHIRWAPSAAADLSSMFQSLTYHHLTKITVCMQVFRLNKHCISVHKYCKHPCPHHFTALMRCSCYAKLERRCLFVWLISWLILSCSINSQSWSWSNSSLIMNCQTLQHTLSDTSSSDIIPKMTWRTTFITSKIIQDSKICSICQLQNFSCTSWPPWLYQTQTSRSSNTLPSYCTIQYWYSILCHKSFW